MKKLFTISAKLKSEKGVALIYVAIMLVVFIGVAAFAIDVGYQRVVRNQLQNAADAAALAACNRFYRDPSNPQVLTSLGPPDWLDAVAEVTTDHGNRLAAIKVNTADAKQLSQASIATGWWDITQSLPGSLWSASTPPSYPPNNPPTSNYGPAVSVTIAKAGTQNNGPIANFFGGILGVSSTNASATATAVAAAGPVRPNALLPLAINKAVADQEGTYNSPSKTIRIGSAYHYPTSQAGQWTSFNVDSNNVPTIRDLLATGNPTALSIGDDIWIQPGTKTTLYSSVPVGVDVVLPIVQNIDTHSYVPIVGFIGFHITASVGGSGKYIEGYFTTAPVYGGGPIGPNYGRVDRCRLCQ